MSGPHTLFLYALNSLVTRERYSIRIRHFLDIIDLNGDNNNDNNNSLEDPCRIFVEQGKGDPNWIIYQ